MRDQKVNFPIEKIENIILSAKEKSEANKEKILECDAFYAKHVPNKVEDRYKFSKYLLNPNKYRFRTVLRFVGLVFLFIKKLSDKCLKRKLEFLVQKSVKKRPVRSVSSPCGG